MSISSPRIYRANGNDEGSIPADGKTYTLEELQAIVGGLIEMIVLADGRMMVVNEERKLLGLPYNETATRLFSLGGWMWFDLIVGDVLVCDESWFDADDDDDDDDNEIDDFSV